MYTEAWRAELGFDLFYRVIWNERNLCFPSKHVFMNYTGTYQHIDYIHTNMHIYILTKYRPFGIIDLFIDQSSYLPYI